MAAAAVRRWSAGGPARWILRGLLDLTKEPAELTVTDHRARPRRRANVRQKESESWART